MTFNPDIHGRRSIRLKEYDYSQEGVYFITICTQNRECLFGEIVKGKIILKDAGKIVKHVWDNLINHVSNIQLEEFIVMPNHIHGIIMIHYDFPIVVGAGSKPALRGINLESNSEWGSNFGSKRAGLEPAPTKHGLSEIIRQFKTFSARRINEMRQTPGIPVWQRNYYEHIIRNEQSFQKIKEYIINNPVNWENDEMYRRGDS